MLIGYVVCAMLAFVFIGFVLGVALFVYWLVMTIVAGIKASEGIHYRYPVSLRIRQVAASRAEENLVGRVAGLLGVRVVQLLQMLHEVRAICGRHLDAGKHAAVVRAVIAIVEQADVPA